MKKLMTLSLALLMLVCTLTACGESKTEETPSTIPNPMVESDAEGVKQALGFELAVPEGAENVHYFIISDEMEELHFTLDGLDYVARLKASAEFEDISGMYYEWTDTQEDNIGSCLYKFMRYCGDEGDVELCLWYDAAPGLMYSLSTSDSSLDGFDITAIARQVYAPMQKNS